MEIRESREGDVLVLAPDGSLAGMEETSALEARLAAALKGGTRLLVMDCAGVGQMASSAIRALLQTSRKLGRGQGRLVLCRMNAKVQKAFSVSGFDKDFTVVTTLEEALGRVTEPVGKAPSQTAKARAAKAADAAEAVASSSPAAEQAPPFVPDEPTPTPPAGADPHEALALALLDVLGVRVLEPAAGSSDVTPQQLDALADGILAALGSRAS
jgi:anti-anti-sigma factor